MYEITDVFLKELFEATKAKQVEWKFQYSWDIFEADYKGMKLVFEHTITKSMRYDSLALGVFNGNQFGLYRRALHIDSSGTATSSPEYDLLLAIRKAAIANGNPLDHPGANMSIITREKIIDIFKATESKNIKWEYDSHSESYSVMFEGELVTMTVENRHRFFGPPSFCIASDIVDKNNHKPLDMLMVYDKKDVLWEPIYRLWSLIVGLSYNKKRFYNATYYFIFKIKMWINLSNWVIK